MTLKVSGARPGGDRTALGASGPPYDHGEWWRSHHGLPHIVVDGDQATALNYIHVHKRASGPVILATAGANTWITLRISVNFWRLERTPDGWKVAHRVNRLMSGSDEARLLLAKVDRG